MKKYIEHMKQQPPHERRMAAIRIASVVTGVIFVGWLATLGVRLGEPVQKTAAEASGFSAQVASIFSAFSLKGAKPNTLEAASTTSNY